MCGSLYLSVYCTAIQKHQRLPNSYLYLILY
jgi:hypothetical protein